MRGEGGRGTSGPYFGHSPIIQLRIGVQLTVGPVFGKYLFTGSASVFSGSSAGRSFFSVSLTPLEQSAPFLSAKPTRRCPNGFPMSEQDMINDENP
jgi:hypothetical protein